MNRFVLLVVLSTLFSRVDFGQSPLTKAENKAIRSIAQRSLDLKKELGNVSKYKIEAIPYSTSSSDPKFKDPFGCDRDRCAFLNLRTEQGDMTTTTFSLAIITNLTRKTIRVMKLKTTPDGFVSSPR